MLKKFIDYIDLRHEIEDFNLIHNEIEKGVVFKGTNLWILMFAIVVASVGLNTNSTAVIIGAMLISPLMGPINGMGYSIATYNFDLLKKSVKNFTFAVIASLIASTFYFAISPVSTAQSELLARTTPTIYDVLIALFGGLAGIVAISSKLKGNVIPGVAIATALMPPLCTAGYGLATSQFNFFFGAFYLFTINTVFIAISSVLVSQFFKFPISNVVEESRKKSVNRWITIIITITLLPSIYFGYKLVLNEKFNENAAKFISNVTTYEGSYLLKYNIDAPKKEVKLIYGGNLLSDDSKLRIKKSATDFEIIGAKIVIEQGFSFNESSIDENQVLKNKLNATLFQLEKVKKTVDSISTKPMFGKELLKEIRPLFPQIYGLAYSDTYIFNDTQDTTGLQKLALIVINVKSKSLKKSDEESVNQWLNARLKTDKYKVYFVE
ncbi:DUF389 domain-containing protein [Candidatus Kapaibacterium sp.]